MTDFINYTVQYWYLVLLLLVLIIITIFVMLKAMQSSAKRKLRRDAIIASLENEKARRNKYRTLTSETLENGDSAKDFLLGVAANIQIKIEKSEDLVAQFDALSEQKRYIYSISFLFENDVKKLSDFFRFNGSPLVPCAIEAAKAIVGGEFAQLIYSEYEMFDEDNEKVSYSLEEIGKIDDLFEKYMSENGIEVFETIKKYILSYFENFADE